MMNTIKQVLSDHKVFTFMLLLMLAAVLIRIPLGLYGERSIIYPISHFVFPAVGTPLLYILMVRRAWIPNFRSKLALFFIVMLGTMIEVLWEIFEFLVDTFLGKTWQPSNADTMMDIILGVVGSLLGGLLFAKLYDLSYVIKKKK